MSSLNKVDIFGSFLSGGKGVGGDGLAGSINVSQNRSADSGAMAMGMAATATSPAQAQKLILLGIADAPDGIGLKDLMSKVELPPSDLIGALADLVKSGALERGETDGVAGYRLTGLGREFVAASQ